MYSIQGLKTVSNSLPKGLKKIFKKGGHNYNSIIENWSNLVGKKISDVCYPKSIKTNRELKDGLLTLNVFHGDQLFVEYNKNEIIVSYSGTVPALFAEGRGVVAEGNLKDKKFFVAKIF